MGYECDKCKILIVEDELLVRKALRYIIEQESDEFEIIGEVTNGEEALEFLEQSLPHMMICDIMMPRAGASARRKSKVSGGVHDHSERIPGF